MSDETQKPLTPEYPPENTPVALTPAQLQEIVTAAVRAAQPAPDPEAVRKAEVALAQQLQERKEAAVRATAAAEQEQVKKARCNHHGGCSFVEGLDGKPIVSQGKSLDSSIILNKGSHWPTSLDDSFLICQRCQRVWLSTDPQFNEIFERCA